jgi:excisionase family DNA binding protein
MYPDDANTMENSRVKKSYSPKQVEGLLGICHSTVYELLKKGKLKSFKIGKSRKIFEESIEELQQERADDP